METVAPFKEVIAEIGHAGGGALRLCYQCGKCDTLCPWNRVRAFSMRRLIREASLGLTEIESEDIWRCTTCGSCPAECPRGVAQIEVGVALRRIASGYDVFPAAARSARTARGSLLANGNPLGEARESRADWAQGLAVRPFAEGMELLYFVGCYLSYDPRLRRVARAAARILERAGVDFGILGARESCCGESVRKIGGEEVWKALARENIKAFIDSGVKKILVSSPHCYHTLRNEYPELMVRFEVVHIAQLVAQLLAEGRLRLTGALGKRVTYHDPCYLGRHNGVYDEPRAVLAAVPGLELVEMSESRGRSLCCGGGGGRIWMDTPKGERFSDLRLAQARETGAAVLCTSCPYCISNFEESRLALGDDEPLEVRDLVELVEQAL
jgi:Fe-S oxidoreductase